MADRLQMHEALEAVLLFHRPGHWNAAKRERWKNLTTNTRWTKGREATTKVLCDLVREALGDADE